MDKTSVDCGPVPKRWMHCPRKSYDLIIDKFLAFKTPLSENFNSLVPPDCRFFPRMVFEPAKSRKIKFGLWIDLTNTSRFYSKDEIEKENCKYIKLQCRGHGETPSVDQTNTFINLIHTFIIHHPLERIAVHCTHGFNRTGFLIVSYLVEKLDSSLDKALDIFAKLRPPGIYKNDYIEELCKRYNFAEDMPPTPSLPSWCFEDDSDIIDNKASTSNSFKKNGQKRNTATFMVDLPDVEYLNNERESLYYQQKIQKMCKFQGKGFPGSQPVSMTRENITNLHNKPYRVSWKADGMRYMMLIDCKNKVFLFDRDNNVFQVKNLLFPQRKNLNNHIQDTLLDGEMVIDKVNGQDIPRYLAYDIVKFEGQPVGQTEYYTSRLYCIENEIIKPRHMAIECGLINKSEEPFSVRKKDFWEITQAANLLGEKFAKTLSHEPDGLIFQPAKDPYTPGRCDDVLKWKPLELNSVDFLLKISREGGTGLITKKICLLYVGQSKEPFYKMKYTKNLAEYDGKIIECKWENNQWKFMRVRTDKSYPNSYETAKAVIGTILNPVTKEALLQYINDYRFDDDCERMPPPTKIRKR